MGNTHELALQDLCLAANIQRQAVETLQKSSEATRPEVEAALDRLESLLGSIDVLRREAVAEREMGKLAKWLIANRGGDIRDNEGAVDVAIRLMEGGK